MLKALLLPCSINRQTLLIVVFVFKSLIYDYQKRNKLFIMHITSLMKLTCLNVVLKFYPLPFSVCVPPIYKDTCLLAYLWLQSAVTQWRIIDFVCNYRRHSTKDVPWIFHFDIKFKLHQKQVAILLWLMWYFVSLRSNSLEPSKLGRPNPEK